MSQFELCDCKIKKLLGKRAKLWANSVFRNNAHFSTNKYQILSSIKHQRMPQKLLFKENISIFMLTTINTKQARELRCEKKV